MIDFDRKEWNVAFIIEVIAAEDIYSISCLLPLYGEVWVCDCSGTKTHKAACGGEGTKYKCFKDWSVEVKSTEKDEALPLVSIIRICSSCEYTDWAPLWFWSCLSMMWSRMRNHLPYIIFECPPAVQYWTLSAIPSSPVIFPSSFIYDNLDTLLRWARDTSAYFQHCIDPSKDGMVHMKPQRQMLQ